MGVGLKGSFPFYQLILAHLHFSGDFLAVRLAHKTALQLFGRIVIFFLNLDGCPAQIGTFAQIIDDCAANANAGVRGKACPFQRRVFLCGHNQTCIANLHQILNFGDMTGTAMNLPGDFTHQL